MFTTKLKKVAMLKKIFVDKKAQNTIKNLVKKYRNDQITEERKDILLS